MIVTRREILSLIASLTASAVLVSGCARATMPVDLQQLHTAFFDSLGRAYLTKFPDQASVELLIGTLQVSPSRSIDAIRLREQISKDYQSDATVVVDGWHLARTEAQLYALLSLLK